MLDRSGALWESFALRVDAATGEAATGEAAGALGKALAKAQEWAR